MTDTRTNPFADGFFTLVITEKPSVAQHIAGVLGAYHRKEGYWEGNGHRVSWCLGHLAEMAPPEVYDPKFKKWEMEDLPILPEHWILQADESKAKQLELLYDLMNRSETMCIVNACDAGREGELIFRNVYELSKSTVPVKRLWLNSMEEDAMKEAFENMKPGSDYDNLAKAAQCRARADWLVGINATRAYSIHYGDATRVGRVQTPTLVMLTSREKEIQFFEEKLTWTVQMKTEQGLVVESDPFDIREEASRLSAECLGERMTITKVETKDKTGKTPELYDLTTLQREANRYHGYSAKQTLELLQELYDAKLITYPRTDSRYCTRDMEYTVMQLLKAIPEFDGFSDLSSEGKVSRVLDNGKVTDHTAILPTKQLTPTVFREQSPEKQNLLRLLFLRLVEATDAEEVVRNTNVEAECLGISFHAHGRQVLKEGYTHLRTKFRNRFLPGYHEEEDPVPTDGFRDLSQGQVLPVSDVSVEKHVSKPPKHYTEDTLLRAMENAESKTFSTDVVRKGLGTPATRAGMIEKLVGIGYLERKGRRLIPTENGMVIASRMPETLCSAALTAEWENKLLDIEKGKGDPDAFMEEIRTMVQDLIHQVKELPPVKKAAGLAVGPCPRCGAPVMEGKKYFYCTSRDCSFALWKDNRFLAALGKELDRDMAKALLETGVTHVTDFYSRKKKRNFVADLCLVLPENGSVRYELSFPNEHD